MGSERKLEMPPMGTHALGSEKVSVDRYVSPRFFEIEKRQVFGKSWLLAGRESDVSKPGEFIRFDIEALPVSIVVVRGKDAQLRAFHNVCTHRGARLVSTPCGKARGGLVCPLHGWAFSFDGTVANVPGQDTFRDLDLDAEGLREVSVGVWGGFVFVNLAGAPASDLRDYLSVLGEPLESYLSAPGWRWSHGWNSRLKANWKLVLDAQLEGYHVDQNHRNTIAGFVPSDFSRPYVFPDSQGVPGGVATFLAEELDPRLVSPVQVIAGKYAPSADIPAAANGNGVFREHPNWLFDNYLLFPNVVMFVQRNRVSIQRTTPISVEESIWEEDVFDLVEPTNFAELFRAEQDKIQGRDALTEDLLTAEGIHQNFKSGAISHVSYSKQEVVLRAFAQKVDSLVRADKLWEAV